MKDLFNCFDKFGVNSTDAGNFYSLPLLEKNHFANLSKLPISLRIILESVLRNYDGEKITFDHINSIANWQPNAKRDREIPFVPSRVILQDYTGVPLLADLAAMRVEAKNLEIDPRTINPSVPVSLVIDHSLHTYFTKGHDAVNLNMEIEFKKNFERFEFIKWASNAFENFEVIPPGVGIVHQVNLEYLSKGVLSSNDKIYYPDTVIGTDSHTTMANGIGIVGWGVGGIEAESAMLGQPIYFLMPDVIGVRLHGKLKEGVTVTDLVLLLTKILREENVVGKIVEYFGNGVKNLSAQDRATIANMAPEYGATMGFFGIDEITISYYEQTGKSKDEIQKIKNYFQAQKLYNASELDDCSYTKIIELDLNSALPCVAGPKRPESKITLSDLKSNFEHSLVNSVSCDGYGLNENEKNKIINIDKASTIKHGDILVAGITSCTNTSNPRLLIAAGLLAKKAYEKGLKVKEHIKSSLTPGSKVVTEYLKASGLLEPLEKMGFSIAGYGCATCVGNIGNLDDNFESAVVNNNLIAAAVLSGNRNFEARIHPNIRANFLMSPPLVIAFSIAGTVRINMDTDPLGYDKNAEPVFLKDIWPTSQEIDEVIRLSINSQMYKESYGNLNKNNLYWNGLEASNLPLFTWNPNSTYIAKPPFFNIKKSNSQNSILNARALAVFGDSITTDHISPAGSINPKSPAGEYLLSAGISIKDFNTYGSRRGNHEVMVRGTFSNNRLKNKMLNGTEGGYTLCLENKEILSIYDAAMIYQEKNISTIIIAGEEYGTGSSRDWAAKGTKLLGVTAVIAKSFERIHRNNLVGMGVLPCQFKQPQQLDLPQLAGDLIFDISGLDELRVNKEIMLIVKTNNNDIFYNVPLILRLDTEIEIDYFKHGGILPYVLKKLN